MGHTQLTRAGGCCKPREGIYPLQDWLSNDPKAPQHCAVTP